MKYFTDAFENAQTAEEIQQAEEAARQKELTATRKRSARGKYKIGEMVEGKGIYFGVEHLKETGKRYALFAAPEDLTDDTGKSIFTFAEAAREVAKRKNWHGFDGGKRSDRQLHKDLASGAYDGTWFIPTLKQLKTLYRYRDLREFKGTFTTVQDPKPRDKTPAAYWSCTEEVQGQISVMHFCRGEDGWNLKRPRENDAFYTSCRPCRAELML
jgi:hypothetical protein